jgi:hypothetical protein
MPPLPLLLSDPHGSGGWWYLIDAALLHSVGAQDVEKVPVNAWIAGEPCLCTRTCTHTHDTPGELHHHTRIAFSGVCR